MRYDGEYECNVVMFVATLFGTDVHKIVLLLSVMNQGLDLY